MDDPPIVSPSPNQPPERSEETNPYEPVKTVAADDSGKRLPGRTQLGGWYWGGVAVGLVLALLMMASQPGVGMVALIGLASSACRVPIVQRRLMSDNPARELPNSLLMLLVSGLLTCVFATASLIAFGVVCVPLAFLAFSTNESNAMIALVFGASGLVALGVFGFLYYLSLRLSL
ncbi:MAG: hypothetical protein KDB22_25370 [Planctomycetales bacterium]|nr:hypothetical protein [Planctomycetales bacterium]